MNLFDGNIKNSINVALFTDERKNISDTWNYICTIIIPTKRFNSLYDNLMNHRKTVGYYNELKFRDIGQSGAKLELAVLWLSEILHDKEKNIYFKILGLDSKLLNANVFGEKSMRTARGYANSYNRFFRTNVFGVNYFFCEYNNIIIDGIFHDNEGNLQNHPLFSWHCISKIKDESKKIIFRCNKIKFVDSDHYKETHHPKVSQIIQLSDILIGTVSHCLDYEHPKHKGRNILGELLCPLLKRILTKPNNINSSYKYYRKYDVNFFPTSVPVEFKSIKQYLHKNRQLLILKKIDKAQKELW